MRLDFDLARSNRDIVCQGCHKTIQGSQTPEQACRKPERCPHRIGFPAERWVDIYADLRVTR